MNIENVVIVNDFNYIQGGASKVAIDTAKILRDNGKKVYFFSAVSKKEENINGIEYITTNQKEALKEKNRLKGFLNGLYNFKAKKELKKLLNKLDRETTVIHIHGWTKALSSSVFDIAFKMNFKIVLTLHDYFTACPNGGYFNYKENEICHLKPLSWKCIKCNCDSRNYIFKLYRILRQFIQNNIVKLNKKLKYVITISDFSEKILKNTLPKNIFIKRIYNPVDIEYDLKKADPAKNEYFLYVGRISKEKGVDIFCQAITELNYKGIGVGDGDELEKLKRIYNKITFTGWKSTKEVKEYMKNAKALVFPSRWYETAGLTILEAQAVGIPCIVSKNCAGIEFLDYDSGYVFENIEDLKKCMKEINNKKNIEVNSKYKNNYATEIMNFYASL